MDYEGQICRPPMERASYMLPVAVGCSYNQCTFCTLFKHLTYRELPMEQIEAEIHRVHDLGGDPQQVFFGDGNALQLPTHRLLEILEKVHTYFPSCRQVNMDATVTNLRSKSDQELRQLHQAGVTMLYLGIESGLEDVLAFMKKDHTLPQAYEQIQRLQEAGMVYGAHFMTGIAGAGRGLENARATAEFFNRTHPQRLINFSMFLHKKAPLYQDIQSGRFLPASELENMQEERELLSLLDGFACSYDGFHDFVTLRVRGILPKDRDALVAKLDQAIAQQQGKEPVFALVE